MKYFILMEKEQVGSKENNNNILFTSFNQDQGCFSCGTEEGFKIYNSYPFKDSHKRSKFNISFIS
jgi:hypothetical protein